MSNIIYQSAYPIGDSDPANLPVANAQEAATFYETQFGFHRVAETETPFRTVTLRRDAVEITLAENGNDPKQASCYIETANVEAARAELAAKGADITPIRTDTYGENSYRVFFVRAPDGLCYCVGQKHGA